MIYPNPIELMTYALDERPYLDSESDLVGLRDKARLGATANKTIFDHVEKYLTFLGYPRSGHSLIGALLDAHPEMVIAHELDALRLFEAGFSKNEVFQVILENSHAFSAIRRQWGKYTHEVKQQWHGRYQRLRVIGDKKGGVTAQRLLAAPDLLDLILALPCKPIFIHAYRNPYDMIAQIWLKDYSKIDPNPTLLRATKWVFDLHKTIEQLRKRRALDVLDIDYSKFVHSPVSELSRVIDWLGLQANDDYLHACEALVKVQETKARHRVTWTSDVLDLIEREKNEDSCFAQFTMDGD